MNQLQIKIKELKDKFWLTSQLAARIGVNPSTIARWADGPSYSESGFRLLSEINELPPEPGKPGRPLGSKTTAKKAKKKGRK